MYDNQWQQPIHLSKINGIDDLKTVRLPRNSEAPYFLANDDVFILRATDEYGQQLPDRAFRFQEISMEELMPVSMSRAEFNELREMMTYVKQLVQQSKQSEESRPEE